MKRKTQVSGYTRKVGGKTVSVKPHSRMTGKEGVNTTGTSAKPGEEFESHQPGRAGEEDYVYKPGKYAYEYTEEEWDAMAREAARKREETHGALRNRVAQSVYGKEVKIPLRKSSRSEKYSSMQGFVGDVNRLADRIGAWADSHSRKKRK